MTSAMLDGLRALAASLPPGTAIPVPREALLELLEGVGEMVQTPATPPADLTVQQLATRYGRHGSTVRQWLERGLFPGAYKLRNRDWRAPAAAIAAFDARERAREVPGAGATASIGDWRKVTAGGTV